MYKTYSGLRPGSPEWLEARRSFICGSDAPVIAGATNWKRPDEVCHDKWGTSAEVAPSKAMIRGLELQEVVKRAYQIKTGRPVFDEIFCQSSRHEFMAATPDGRVHIDDRWEPVQIKTHVNWIASQYGPALSDNVPEYEYIQTAHELEVLEADRNNLVVLFATEEQFDLLIFMVKTWPEDLDRVAKYILDNHDLRPYEIERDQVLVENLVEMEREFFEKYIQTKTLPPESPMADHDQLIRSATEVEAELIARWREAYIKKVLIDERFDGLKDKILKSIGASLGIRCEKNGAITYKAPAPDVTVDWKSIVLEHVAGDPGADPRDYHNLITRARPELIFDWEIIARDLNIDREKALVEKHTKEAKKPRRIHYPYKNWKASIREAAKK